MNVKDRHTCQAADEYWQMCVKKIDQFLDRAIKYYNKHGKSTFESTDRDQLDQLIGYLNTIAMLIQKWGGVTTNWDQATLSYTDSFNKLGDNNPMNQENANDNVTMKQT